MSRKLKIDQFVHTLQYGDAISGEALSIKRILEDLGHDSEIYSLNTHQKLLGIPRKMEDFKIEEKRDAIILHYSIGSSQNKIYAEISNAKKFIIYHNLTPEKWFSSYNFKVTSDLSQGKYELPSLLQLSDYCLADSNFNADELKSFGVETPLVLPLLIDPKRWEAPANQGIVSALKATRTSTQGANILHVGRIAPNKCIDDIIKSFYFYHHKFDQTSRLWLVGHDIDTEIYSFELRQLVEELRLKGFVNFVGSVSDDELQGFYEASDIYLCMSEHEGFCVPLIEALHHGLPVIAFSSSAIPETLGSGGILLDEKDPLKTALIIKNLLSDTALRSSLKEIGQKQIEKFSVEIFTNNLKTQILDKL